MAIKDPETLSDFILSSAKLQYLNVMLDYYANTSQTQESILLFPHYKCKRTGNVTIVPTPQVQENRYLVRRLIFRWLNRRRGDNGMMKVQKLKRRMLRKTEDRVPLSSKIGGLQTCNFQSIKERSTCNFMIQKYGILAFK